MKRLKCLQSNCKYHVAIEINRHRGNYISAKEEIENRRLLDEDFELDPEVERIMIDTDTIVDIYFYPANMVGFYHVLHYDIEQAVDEAAKILGYNQ